MKERAERRGDCSPSVRVGLAPQDSNAGSEKEGGWYNPPPHHLNLTSHLPTNTTALWFVCLDTHTFMSNCCFAFFSAPHKASMHHSTDSAYGIGALLQPHWNRSARGPSFPLKAKHQARACGTTSVILSHRGDHRSHNYDEVNVPENTDRIWSSHVVIPCGYCFVS